MNKGEEIDAQAIATYLRAQMPTLEGVPTIKQFKGGASNLTYELRFSDRSVILRRPPTGTKAKSAHNMAREYDIMKRLEASFPVPKMLHLCQDESILGSEFYLMEKLDGFIPRTNFPPKKQPPAEQVRELCRHTLDHLIHLHKLDYRELGFEDYYKREGYVRRQVEGWTRRFRKARTPDVPDCEFIMEWLAAEMPPDRGASIIHNDFRFDNVVYHKENWSEILGVLDWEMATVGDPLMDLGGSLAYWIEAKDPFCLRLLRRQPTHHKGMMTRDEVVAYYLKNMGFEGVNMKFYYIFGLFRLIGIIQQIYYRYYHRQSSNPRFSAFGVGVKMLETYCRKLIASPSDRLSVYPLNAWDNLYFSYLFLKHRKK